MALELKVREISFSYQQNNRKLPVLENINIEVIQGEFVCIIGPSGCGKSTLFNLLTGLSLPDQGEILLSDRDISGQRGQIAYMPQKDLLFPWRSVIENVILGAEISGRSVEESKREAEELLPLFGLEGFADSYPAELSGGMRQRAALLRTVLIHKDIMALDEPFGALDAITRKEMQNWLLEVWRELNKTILFITHDIEESLLLADKIYVLSERPGQIVEEIQVSLPRPRQEIDSKFVELKGELLRILYQK